MSPSASDAGIGQTEWLWTPFLRLPKTGTVLFAALGTIDRMLSSID
jgi:hypothetical protein